MEAEVEAEQPAAEVGSGFGSFWRIHAGNTLWAHSERVHHFVLRVPARFNSQKVKDEAALFAVLFGTSETEKLNKLVKQPILFFGRTFFCVFPPQTCDCVKTGFILFRIGPAQASRFDKQCKGVQ